jgi:D-serine deaminase-like pyridoxal phosphate-dependent protein
MARTIDSDVARVVSAPAIGPAAKRFPDCREFLMDPRYALKDPSAVYSPALLFYRAIIRDNIRHMIARAGGAVRLRPHVKTHKTRQIVRMQLEAGVAKHKCATIAEAEMLGELGVPDVLLAYPLVGPNCARFAKLVRKFPRTTFSTLADHRLGVEQLSAALADADKRVPILLDIDVGQHRTGIAPEATAGLYELLAKAPGLAPGGLHVYDGHNHQESLSDRRVAVIALLKDVWRLQQVLLAKGLPVPRLVLGGTPTFPVHAEVKDQPGVDIELSPGTCVLNDHGYGTRFTDLGDFVPAALLLTRVISRPTPTRICFDLGYKAVASDPPAGKRLVLLDFPPCEPVIHNEEHFVVECADRAAAERYQPGAVAYAMPTHICPTSALHRQAYVVEDGQVVDMWDIAARDRALTI